ncbi:snapalysin family zinc-dependent metalloprotease [Streptomyces sp. NPDC046832]|uniref:snapalysin family zinc-dependent metalloprotease n=1 Tax=Streptomyces sp. NPDC046832 TaxID=3155020 RepID=UPI0034020BA4
MHVRMLTGGLAAACLVSLSLTGGQVAAAAEAPVAARVLTYDASGSAEFQSAVNRGAAIWNESVDAVELRPVTAGQRANIRVLADNGWPRALPGTLGNGTVYIGRQAVDQGYDTIRISAHELGHILGLPDRKPGPCSSLMSGSTAGTSCTNPYPNAAEKSEVEGKFGGALAGPVPAARAGVIVD